MNGLLETKRSRGSFVKSPDFNKKILVVDDESAILQTLRFNLERSGYAVMTASDGRSAVAMAQREQPDLVMLDIMLPVLDGVEACKEIRKFSSVPIIMLTAKDQEIDKVLALELGADDYVTKPFALHEFLARVKARLRRRAPMQPDHEEAISSATSSLDPSRQQLTVRGKDVSLAPKEFALLRVLMENNGRVVTRQTLLDKVWGYDFEGEQQTVSVHIRWLREKIEETRAIRATSSRCAAAATCSRPSCSIWLLLGWRRALGPAFSARCSRFARGLAAPTPAEDRAEKDADAERRRAVGAAFRAAGPGAAVRRHRAGRGVADHVCQSGGRHDLRVRRRACEGKACDPSDAKRGVRTRGSPRRFTERGPSRR